MTNRIRFLANYFWIIQFVEKMTIAISIAIYFKRKKSKIFNMRNKKIISKLFGQLIFELNYSK